VRSSGHDEGFAIFTGWAPLDKRLKHHCRLEPRHDRGDQLADWTSYHQEAALKAWRSSDFRLWIILLFGSLITGMLDFSAAWYTFRGVQLLPRKAAISSAPVSRSSASSV
jgi:hypothetical protein